MRLYLDKMTCDSCFINYFASKNVTTYKLRDIRALLNFECSNCLAKFLLYIKENKNSKLEKIINFCKSQGLYSFPCGMSYCDVRIRGLLNNIINSSELNLMNIE